MAENNNTIAGAPPPPPEVKVRTMRSDLESMARTGGGLPQFQNVQISGLPIERASAKVAAAVEESIGTQTQVPVPNNNVKKILPLLLVVIVAIIAIAVVGYFAYATLFK